MPIKLSFFNQTRQNYDSIDLTAKKGTASFNGSENDNSLSKPWNNDDDGYALIEFTDANFSSHPDMPVKLSLWAVPGDDLGSGGNFEIATFHLNILEDFSDSISFVQEGSDWEQYILQEDGAVFDGSTDSKRLVIEVPENDGDWEMNFVKGCRF